MGVRAGEVNTKRPRFVAVPFLRRLYNLSCIFNAYGDNMTITFCDTQSPYSGTYNLADVSEAIRDLRCACAMHVADPAEAVAAARLRRRRYGRAE